MEYILTPMLMGVAQNCSGGTVDLTGVTGACAGGSGTVALSGTASCQVTGTPPTNFSVTISSVSNASITLNQCAGTPEVDSQAYSIAQTGTSSSFTASNFVVALVDGTPTISGSLSVGFSSLAMGGDITATLGYTQAMTFTDFDPNVGSGIACAANPVTVTESGETGTCTIATTCGECS